MLEEPRLEYVPGRPHRGDPGAGSAGATSTGWPQVKGVLCVLFTARSGSTYLCRELEVLFNLGRIRRGSEPGQGRDARIGARLEARSRKSG